MFRHVSICFGIMFCYSLSLFGQSAPSNPFDLLHRLPQVSVIGGPSSLPAASTNPFDVVKHSPPAVAMVSSPTDPNKNNSSLPKILLPKGKSKSKTFLFWSLVASFGFLTFSIAANRSVVEKAWRGFLNENHLALAHRESTGLVGSTPYFLLYSNFLINCGIFSFLITRYFKGDDFNNISYLLLCILGISLLFLIKHAMLFAVSWLYPIANEAKRYNFMITVFNCILGLFLVPFNFLIAFARDFEPFLVFWTLGLVAVFYAYRSLRALGIGQKFLVGDQFHFLLYLCAAEIAPVLLIFKLITTQTN